jgi:hypothetical protein
MSRTAAYARLYTNLCGRTICYLAQVYYTNVNFCSHLPQAHNHTTPPDIVWLFPLGVHTEAILSMVPRNRPHDSKAYRSTMKSCSRGDVAVVQTSIPFDHRMTVKEVDAAWSDKPLATLALRNPATTATTSLVMLGRHHMACAYRKPQSRLLSEGVLYAQYGRCGFTDGQTASGSLISSSWRFHHHGLKRQTRSPFSPI